MVSGRSDPQPVVSVHLAPALSLALQLKGKQELTCGLYFLSWGEPVAHYHNHYLLLGAYKVPGSLFFDLILFIWLSQVLVAAYGI